MIQAANIKVAVRIRPLLEEEVRSGHTDSKLEVDQVNTCINVLSDRTNVYKNSQFDYVLDQDSSQRKVFDKVGMNHLVKQVVDGYHATVFAYGQTGSGKTFTMEGYKYRNNEKGVPTPVIEQGENEGLVPRSILLLFEQIKQQTNLQKKKFTVYCSYLQIYKEKIFDLLNKAQLKRLISDGPGLKLKWNKHDHFTVENLYTFECRSPDDVLALYHFGVRNKVVASHNMNNSSSRSHTMLSLTIEQVDAKNPDNVVTSKLQLVDLAGSERQAFTGNQANKESIDINKSLFTLRQVITALTEKKNQGNQNSYIPYRESKLTSLLRQSLGGNSYCLMIACLNPCDQYVDENISTLQYASKASFISNKPIRNDDPRMRLIEQLKKENKTLNEELSKANDTIQFLSQITGNNPQTIKQNLQNVQMPGQQPNTLTQVNQHTIDNLQQMQDVQRQGSASSAITEKRGESSDRRQLITERIIKDKDNIEKFFKDKSETLQNIANMNKPMSSGLPSAANESKDAITERIIHTVNMMKEVLQSNLNLRETIQKQSEMIDNLNADIFQLQSENEDLRDRIQILEEYTGKDTYSDVTKLVKEKKVLENRVKHLEQTSMNWAQFQATRQNFHQQKDKVNSSQIGILPKATLNNEFNDDYEPVRCAINNNQDSLNAQDSYTNQPSATTNTNSKKKRKLEQLNYQKQLNRGPRQNLLDHHHQSSNAVASSSDRHQEYKIRTVKSLANAYQQASQNSQQYFRSRANQAQTTKNNYQNNSSASSKFINQHPSGMNHTTYDRQRNSVGFNNVNNSNVLQHQQQFNGNNTQELSSYQDEDPRLTKSPEMQPNKKYVQHQTNQTTIKQNADDRYQYYPKPYSQSNSNPYPRDKSTLPPHSNVSLRMKKELEQQQHHYNMRPPKSSDKYSSSSNKKSRVTIVGGGGGQQKMIQQNNSQRDRMNVSADYINNSHNMNDVQVTDDPYDEEGDDENPNTSSYYRHHTYEGDAQDDDDYYDEEVDSQNRNSDAYEALRQQKLKNLNKPQKAQNMNIRSESGFGQLDVSLPMIRNNQQ